MWVGEELVSNVSVIIQLNRAFRTYFQNGGLEEVTSCQAVSLCIFWTYLIDWALTLESI